MLYVDPDPALEREAEESAQQAMKGSALGIQRMADTEVHVQRYAAEAEVDVAAHNESTEVAKQMNQRQPSSSSKQSRASTSCGRQPRIRQKQSKPTYQRLIETLTRVLNSHRMSQTHSQRSKITLSLTSDAKSGTVI